MVKTSLLIGLFLLLFHAPASHARMITPDAVLSYTSACKHYVNRARFLARDAQADFITQFADGCEAALMDLKSGTPKAQSAAAAFLSGLADLRGTIIDINMTRLFGAKRTPFSQPLKGNTARTEALRKVSGTGEYLIAHRMGLIEAYTTWLDTVPHVSLASTQGDTVEKPVP